MRTNPHHTGFQFHGIREIGRANNRHRADSRNTIPRLALCSLLLWGSAAAQQGGLFDEALKEQQRIQQEAVRSQQRIDTLDDESRTLLEEYQNAQEELENLQSYADQMSRMVKAQESEIAMLEQQLEEVEVTQRRILPLMVRMVEVLEQFITLDRPFLPQERRLRLEGLKAVLDDPGEGLGEKYRRILEAYRVENGYAYSIESYTGELTLEGRTRTVDFLRLGRVSLYYLTFDKTEAGYWDTKMDAWQPLGVDSIHTIKRAIRIARKQAPPDLIRLPVAAPKAAP